MKTFNPWNAEKSQGTYRPEKSAGVLGASIFDEPH